MFLFAAVVAAAAAVVALRGVVCAVCATNELSGKKGQLSLMEELYQDLGQLRRRLEEVQAGIDDKSDMYTTLFHR